MKKILTLAAAMILTLCCSITAFASPDYVVDEADLLTDGEESQLNSKLTDISAKYGVDVVVVTVDSTDGKSDMTYADDYYDQNGYGKDGVLLLLDMDTDNGGQNRGWWISTAGYGITAFTDRGIEYIGNKLVPGLSDGDYYEAFDTYADLTDDFIDQANTGKPYDVGNMPDKKVKEPVSVKDILMVLVVALVVGFVLAAGIVSGMKKKHVTVRPKASAGDYVVKGSLNLTTKTDTFLYVHLDRVPIPKNNGGSSTHTSSGGVSHGGGGGRF